MSDNALTVLKFCLMALLYLFLARVVWVVARELRGTPRAAAVPPVPMPDTSRPADGSRRAKTTGWHLAVLAPKAAAGQTYTLSGEITIGRAPGCAIRLEDDTFVSGLHARVFERDGNAWIEDLGSTNGTTVNGGRVTDPVRLRKRDRVEIGGTLLEVRK